MNEMNSSSKAVKNMLRCTRTETCSSVNSGRFFIQVSINRTPCLPLCVILNIFLVVIYVFSTRLVGWMGGWMGWWEVGGTFSMELVVI